MEIKIVTLRNKPAALWDMTLYRLVYRFWRVSGQTPCLSFGQKTSTENTRAARSTVAVALPDQTTRRHEPQHLDHGTHRRNSFISHYGAVFPVKVCHTSCGHNHGPPGTPAAPLWRVATSRLLRARYKGCFKLPGRQQLHSPPPRAVSNWPTKVMCICIAKCLIH